VSALPFIVHHDNPCGRYRAPEEIRRAIAIHVAAGARAEEGSNDVLRRVHCDLAGARAAAGAAPSPEHVAGSGVGREVTSVPLLKLAEQIAPQLMAAGEDITVPEPPPTFVTDNKKLDVADCVVALTGVDNAEQLRTASHADTRNS